MISVRQLFKLMAEYGITKTVVTGKDGSRVEAERTSGPPQVAQMSLPLAMNPQETSADPEAPEFDLESFKVDNSAAMPEYQSVYDDPDLYPDGEDPVSAMMERIKHDA